MTLAGESPKTPPAPAASSPSTTSPTLPAEFKTKIQAIIIQQQQASMQLTQLENQYRTTSQKLQDLSSQSTKLQDEAIKSIGLDPTKFFVTLSNEGDVVVNPKPSTAPATPSTEKK